jgi:hypothetical protein
MLNKKQIINLRRYCEKLLNKDDWDRFDFISYIDENLTYSENKTLLGDVIREHFKKKKQKEKPRDYPKQELEEMKDKALRKEEQKAEIEFQKTLTQIEKDKTTSLIEDIYYIPKTFAKMVANGNAKGFILFGEAGTGKSYSVIRAFKEEKKEFVYLSGHITSLELYNFLYEHRQENIILDDVNILDNEINLNMLKSCLSDNSLVCYHTSSTKLKVPSKFIFNGTICLLLNQKPQKRGESLKAVESRVLNYELKLDYRTKIKVMFELARQEYKDINQDERFEVVKWIRNNTSQATKNLNLRVLFQIYEMYRFDEQNWKKLAGKILVEDRDLRLIVQGLNSSDWCEETGKHRATYFRYKNQLLKNESI